MIDPAAAAHFAEDWYAAWNLHDLDRIMSHYVDDVEFVSPFVAALNDNPSGMLRGKTELRAYFARALERFPDLCFVPLDLLCGLDSVTLYYISVEGRRCAEVTRLTSDYRVTNCYAHYGEANDPRDG
jgi:hypothetical protein